MYVFTFQIKVYARCSLIINAVYDVYILQSITSVYHVHSIENYYLM